MSERDLLGYGGTWPDFTWPNGARLAVSVVVNFEEGAELQVGDGDARSETMGEVTSVVPPGKRDQGQEQIFGYGTRAGLWRMLAALDESAIRSTFLFCGRAVERLPGLARTIVARGHEPAIHGWRWRPHADYDDPEREAADIERCVEAIMTATGQRPLGFFCRGGESPWTRELLAQRGFLYTSNGFDDDLPYWDRSPASGPLLVVPYALDSNDMKFFHPNGFVRAREMVDYVEDALGVLEDEAACGLPRLLNIGFHLRIVGRPARFAAFRDILRLLAGRQEKLWIATRAEIAHAFSAAVPPPPR
ncbi:polysaccharide deacetylase family protein [Bosea sp. 685]|uniref:polysaccharide deacetylase family protein n=1 Tax=Bosea sp. 685 TaxID=3080057 RepID=UPI002892D9C8|nr:polysaccharide deacetylase family protein [Bosea sp. 685]WNJ90110.1 polysaccharide deacetylase family protein [Bosea sp. 685]